MKYNHLVDVAFEVVSEHENIDDLSTEELLAALEKRTNYLKENKEDAAEAFGLCDTYEIDEN